MPHFSREATLTRLRRHFQALPLHVEQPTVIRTAEPAVLDVAVFQRRAAMRTMEAEQTERAILIAKQNQLFAEHFDRLRNIAQPARRADDKPMAAKPCAGWSAGADVRQIGNGSFLSLLHEIVAELILAMASQISLNTGAQSCQSR